MVKSGKSVARLLVRTLVIILSIAAGVGLLILVWAPMLSPYRMVAFLASMLARTGAIVAVVLD